MPMQEYFDNFPPFPDDVPVIDLPCLSFDKLQKQDINESATLFDACQNMGFFLVDFRGNENGEEFLKKTTDMFRVGEQVNAMDTNYLDQFAWQAPGSLTGYKKVGAMKLADGRPDRLSFYTISQDDMLGNTPVRANPSPIESNRASISTYMNDAYKVCTLICTHLERHLHLVPGTLSALQPQNCPSGTGLRMLRYEPQPPEDRQTSLTGHTDIGSMTVLFNVTGGLQILPPGHDSADDSAWAYIRPKPGCAIVNLGDAMVEWSAGILRSNMHRVTWAPGDQAKAMRYSLAYLVRPASDCPMKRLSGEESLIPAREDGEEEDSAMLARDWEAHRVSGIQQGKQNARSRGGRGLKQTTAEIKPMAANQVVSAGGA